MKNTKPYFSIITCTKNSMEFLEDNILSVEKQNYKNYEHIFVDGESTDRTIELINKYIAKSPKRVKIISQIPEGISKAMNKGVEASTGKYLIHLHSDDYFSNKFVLKRVQKYIEKTKIVDMVYGQVRSIDKKGSHLGIAPKFFLFKKSLVWLLKIVNYIPHQAVFIKKDIFTKYGNFDEKLKYCMDYEYWLKNTSKINWKYIPLVISNYRIHDESATSNPDSYKDIESENILVWKKYLNFFELLLATSIRKIKNVYV